MPEPVVSSPFAGSAPFEPAPITPATAPATPIATPAASDPFATNSATNTQKGEKMLFGKKITTTTIILMAVLGVLIVGGIVLAIFLATNQ
jgi:hypothetical protein